MKRYQREEEALRLDEEEQLCEQIEEDLLADVRYLISRVREMRDHDGSDVLDPHTGEPSWVQCDCNNHNRWALTAAIRKLRAWRQDRNYSV